MLPCGIADKTGSGQTINLGGNPLFPWQLPSIEHYTTIVALCQLYVSQTTFGSSFCCIANMAHCAALATFDNLNVRMLSFRICLLTFRPCF